jgi:hypothetical protein
MSTIVTRSGKGSPLTNTEVDANFTNLNTGKAELSGAVFTGAITTNSTIDGRDVAADGVTADAALPKSGGAMTGAITTNSTFDGVDIATRDAVLTSTTTTANAALPKAGGAVTGDISFGDNDKATFGAGDDLQIYHDGTHSYVRDEGTGGLILTTNGAAVYIQKGDTETAAEFNIDGAVKLRYDNLQKFATTSTGIDVTGTATMDGLTVNAGTNKVVLANNFATTGNTDSPKLAFYSFGDVATYPVSGPSIKKVNTGSYGAGDLVIYQHGPTDFTNEVEALRISSAGAATFNSTVTAPQLAITSASTADTITLTRGTNGQNNILKFATGSTADWIVGERNDSTSDFRFYSYGTSSDVLSISRANGNVNIPNGSLMIGATTAPTAPLDVVTNSAVWTGEFLQSNTSNGDGVLIQVGSSASADYALSVRSNAGNNSALAVKADGQVGVGTFTPAHPLHVTKEIAGYQAYFNNDNGSAQGIKVRIKSNDSGNFNMLELVSASSGSDVTAMVVRDDGQLTSTVAGGVFETRSDGGGFHYKQLLDVATAGCLITGRSNRGDMAAIALYQTATGADGGYIKFNTSNSGSTTPTEKMRIDSSGNVLVAGTNINPVGNNVVGHALSSDGRVQHSTTGNTVMKTNQTTQGVIAQFRVAGSAVGSIGTETSNSDLYIGNGDTAIMFHDGADAIFPHNASTNAGRDAAIDIGYSTYRFKDAYLSGGVYLGGTGAANKLDDYEEGTWTPTLPNGGSLTVNRALYTKIGRQVSVQFYLVSINATNDGAQFQIGNLPFTTSSISNSFSAGSISYSGQSDLGGLGLLNLVNGASLYFHFTDGTSGGSVANNTFRGLLASASAGVMIAEISYFTD